MQSKWIHEIYTYLLFPFQFASLVLGLSYDYPGKPFANMVLL